MILCSRRPHRGHGPRTSREQAPHSANEHASDATSLHMWDSLRAIDCFSHRNAVGVTLLVEEDEHLDEHNSPRIPIHCSYPHLTRNTPTLEEGDCDGCVAGVSVFGPWARCAGSASVGSRCCRASHGARCTGAGGTCVGCAETRHRHHGIR